VTSLGISATFIRIGRVGGAENAVYNLLEGIADRPDAPSTRVYTAGPIAYKSPSPRIAVVPLETRLHNRFLVDSVALRGAAAHDDALLFPNYFTPPWPTRARRVTIILDLLYRHHPSAFSAKKRLWLRAAHGLTMRTADAVIGISEFVRDDILSVYGRRYESRVHALPLPVSWREFEQPSATAAEHLGTDRPYILSLAAHWPHKNLETLLRAFHLLRVRWPEHRLVLVGQFSSQLVGGTRMPDLRRLRAELGLDDHVSVTGYVPAATIGALFRGAAAFAFPSLFEGFGIPVVEALGMGLPVVTTRRTSIPEVSRGLAVYVDDPLDAAELADVLSTVLASPARHAPSAESVREVRAYYDPVRVAGLYLRQLAPDGR
jgi:glycosyltransferase involved in cell wall biosynthesis